MRLPTRQKFISQAFQLLVLFQLFSLLVAQPASQKPAINALGVYIDDHDRFFAATVHSTSQADLVAQGSFAVEDSLSVHGILSKSTVPRLERGKIWQTVAADDENAAKLLQDVFRELQKLIVIEDGIEHYEECAIAAPVQLSDSQRDLVSSAAERIFGCKEEISVVRDRAALVSGLESDLGDIGDSSAAVVALDGSTYILGEDYSMLLILEVLPPPFDADRVLLGRTIGSITVLQDDETEAPFGQTHGPNETPIRYEHIRVVARGAARLASFGAPYEPVEVLPLALGVVLHNSLSHIVIPRFSILPQRAEIALTTVHDNQNAVTIDIREGSRPRAQDTLPFTKFILEGITPGPAGTVRINVSIDVDRYFREIVVEAIEPLSGVRSKRIVERGIVRYADGVLEAYDAAEAEHREADQLLRESAYEWVENTSEQHEHAVKLFQEAHRHEEL